MKKTILSILILLICFGCISCSKSKYSPVKSTKEESTVVMILKLDGEEYEIKYELYRALFLANRSAVDGGDRSVWSGENKDDYIGKINEIITEKAAKIFSAFHIAQSLGINPYSKEIDNMVSEYIELSVDGGGDAIGFGGDYNAYLASLKESGLNYSTQDLMLRYSILLEKIAEYYRGENDPVLGYVGGKYNLSDDELRDYYFSDNCVRVLHAYMQDGVGTDTLAKMESLRLGIMSCENDLSIALYIINNTLVTPTDLIVDKQVSGITIGRYSLSDEYAEYAASAFSLSPGQTGEVIEITDGEQGYYVIHSLEKSEDHFSRCNDEITQSFFDNYISKQICDLTEELAKTAKFEKGYYEIKHEDISI